MALVVETGSGSATANSYLAVSDATTLLEATSYATAWAVLSTSNKELALRSATAWLDSRYRFYGQPKVTDQALQWPRTKNYDGLGQVIPAGTIPKELKRATALMSMALVLAAEQTAASVSAAGPVRSWSGDGLSLSWGGQEAVTKVDYLVGQRFPEVELTLRPIGTLKDAVFLQFDKMTVLKA